MRYQATIAKIYRVTWTVDGVKSTAPIYFEHEEDAKTVAAAPLGWYGSSGSVYPCKYVLGEDELPSTIYNTVMEWVDDKLTRNEARNLGFIV